MRPEAFVDSKGSDDLDMSSPLDGCWAKIDRANESIKNLEAELKTLTHPNNYIIIRKVDHNLMGPPLPNLGGRILPSDSVSIGRLVPAQPGPQS